MTIYTAPSPAEVAAWNADPAQWLPVREVIRSAARFAISRNGGDNALAAYVDGLEGIGIQLPDSEGDQVKYHQSYSRNIRVWLTPERNRTDDEWSALTEEQRQEQRDQDVSASERWTALRSRQSYRSDAIRRIEALQAARGVSTGIYVAYPAQSGRYYEPEHTRRTYGEVEISATRTTLAPADADESELDHEWREQQNHAAEMTVRMIRRECAARDIPTYDGPQDDSLRGYTERQYRTNRLHDRVELAAERADEIAGQDQFISTDEFLTMMRDQAVSNHWCGEHHEIIRRLTNGTREPYGVSAHVRFTLDQEFSVNLTSFYGGDGSPEGLKARLEYAIERLMNSATDNYSAAEWQRDERNVDVTLTYSTDGNETTNPADQPIPYGLADDELSPWERVERGLAPNPDDVEPSYESRYYCDECSEYHDA